MRVERGLESLCDLQGLQGGRGFRVGEGHCAELDEAQRQWQEETPARTASLRV